MRAIPALILAGFTVIASVRAAEACSCVRPGPPCQEAWQSSAVFVGRVTSIAEIKRSQSEVPFVWTSRAVTFEVAEAFRGITSKTVVVGTGSGGGDCGYAFSSGQSYLVYAYQHPNGELSTGICSRTRPLGEAGDDLEYLRGAARSPSVIGRVVAQVKFADATLTSMSPGRDYEGARLVLRDREGRTRSGVSDRRGALEIVAPTGTYDITVEVPVGFYAVAPSKVEILDARGCGSVDVYVRTDGRVTGRVLTADGGPAAFVPVQIAPAELRAGPGSGRWSLTTDRSARTDANGEYEITRVPPGTFVLGVGTPVDSQTRGFVATPVFYPGTIIEPEARPTTLAASSRIRLDDITLPASVAYRTISGVALNQDGTPAAGARVSVRVGEKGYSAFGPAAIADATGRFQLGLPAAGTFRIVAERVDNSAGYRLFRSEEVPVGPMTTESVTVTLVGRQP